SITRPPSISLLFKTPYQIQKKTPVSCSTDFFLIKSTKSSVSASDPLSQNLLNHNNLVRSAVGSIDLRF
ncbi:hypothetical protein MKW98_000101, partial [Papaver atlanticum]